jgi:hypothetical protein
MPTEGFEPIIIASERLQNYALDSASTGTYRFNDLPTVIIYTLCRICISLLKQI